MRACAQTGLVAPVLFNIQESLMHIEAIGFDVSPRLINIEPAVIRMQVRSRPGGRRHASAAIYDAPAHALLVPGRRSLL